MKKFFRSCAVWIAENSIGLGIGLLVGMRTREVPFVTSFGEVDALTRTTIELARDGHVRYVHPHDMH